MTLIRVKSTIKLENFNSEYIFKVLNCAFKGTDVEKLRPRGSMAFDSDRRWYKTVLICRIYKLTKLSRNVSLDYYVNRFLLRSNLLN